MDSGRLQAALTAFDRANAQDPKKEIQEGKEVPYELLYAQWMTKWVNTLDPNASEAVLLAARCQHLCRWMIPRTDFDPGRIGYLKWRKRLYQFHAEKAGEILREAGYPEETIEKVQAINLKKSLKDPDTQTIEDALCLVFLEFQFHDFVKKTPPEKMPDIIKKSWAKMSPKAREFALTLNFSKEELELIQKSI
jgi:uncharacterized protein DUF4202